MFKPRSVFLNLTLFLVVGCQQPTTSSVKNSGASTGTTCTIKELAERSGDTRFFTEPNIRFPDALVNARKFTLPSDTYAKEPNSQHYRFQSDLLLGGMSLPMEWKNALNLSGEKYSFSQSQSQNWQEALKRKLNAAEFQAIASYTGSGYRAVNNALWNRKPEDLKEQKEEILTLASALNKLPPVQKEVTELLQHNYLYRGAQLGLTQLKFMHEAKEFYVPAFWSTAVKYSVASSFTKNAILRISQPKNAKYVDPMSSCEGEKEAIFNVSTHFHVKGIYKWKGNISSFRSVNNFEELIANSAPALSKDFEEDEKADTSTATSFQMAETESDSEEEHSNEKIFLVELEEATN